MLKISFLFVAIATLAKADPAELGLEDYTEDEIFSLASEEPALVDEFVAFWGENWSQTIADAYANSYETEFFESEYTVSYDELYTGGSDSFYTVDFDDWYYSYESDYDESYTDDTGSYYTFGDDAYYTDESGNTETLKTALLYYVSNSYDGDSVDSYEAGTATVQTGTRASTLATPSAALVAAGGTGSNNVATSTSGQQAENSSSTPSTKGADGTTKDPSSGDSTTKNPSNSDSTAASKPGSDSAIGRGSGANLYVPVAGLMFALVGAMI